MEKHIFQKLESEKREELEAALFENIVEDFRKEKIQDNYYKYEVLLQDIYFVTYMLDDNLKLSIKYTIDILEELKEINNNGLDKEMLRKRNEESDSDNEVIRALRIARVFKTAKVCEIIKKLDEIHHVGGAYALLISNPSFYSAIYAVYERLVDCFDDEDLYSYSAYFLARATMYMCSKEI